MEQPTTTVLFVEDHLGLIEELVQLLFQERQPGSLDVRFATDADSAIEELTDREFDLIVLDVMLPAIPGVEHHHEGIYLAAWILEQDELPPFFKDRQRPKWMQSKQCPLVLLTSRDRRPLESGFETLVEAIQDGRVTVIERLATRVDEQCKTIIQSLENNS